MQLRIIIKVRFNRSGDRSVLLLNGDILYFVVISSIVCHFSSIVVPMQVDGGAA